MIIQWLVILPGPWLGDRDTKKKKKKKEKEKHFK